MLHQVAAFGAFKDSQRSDNLKSQAVCHRATSLLVNQDCIGCKLECEGNCLRLTAVQGGA